MAVVNLPEAFSLKGIQYGGSLATPKGLTLYRFSGAYDGSSIVCPDEYCQPPADPDTAAELAAQKISEMRLPPPFRDNKSFIQRRIEIAQAEARRGHCKWQVISSEQIEELCHKSKVTKSDEGEDEDSEADGQHTVVGYLLASLYRDGIVKLDAGFRQACTVAEQHWKDNLADRIKTSPEVLIIGGY